MTRTHSPFRVLPRHSAVHSKSRAVHLAVALAWTVTIACAREPAPDLILHNARIWTGIDSAPAAEAIAIRGDRILAIGTEALIMRLAGDRTRVEDMGGRRMVPGFHDAHWHLPTRRTADLVGARDTSELVSRLRDFAATLPAEAWITGRGWTPDMFPGNAAHRRYLDAAFPDRPVLLTDRDGHQALANARALAAAGVGAETPEPAGGAIIREDGGAPTGLLQESAMGLVRRLLPPPTEAEVYAALRHEMRRAASHGLTALQVANGIGAAETAAFERALAEDSLLVRFRIAVPFERNASDSALRHGVALRDGHGGAWLRYGIAKGMLDGTVDAATAAMLAPYARDPGTGIPMWTAAELAAAVARYDSAGLQVELHAIGDRAIRMALDAFEAAARANGPRDRRPRVEHLEVPDPADIPRFARLGVIASTQAIFASPDATTLENYVPMLGAERAARAMPFRALDSTGAVQAFGSDYPVFPMDPLVGMHAAVTRTLADGTPAGGWQPQHRIAVDAALRHYTRDAAFAAFRERELGTLAPGMLADLVVLSEDILGGADGVLVRAKPVLTVVGGRVTFRADSTRQAR
jgi:predicted amidohydrolase YtcJ